MPGYRSKRGGARQGTPGKSYGNRTDLQGAKLPIQSVPGGQYGSAKASEDAQRAVAMAGAPQGGPSVMPAMPEGVAKPGSMPGLFADSVNPDEHVMSGASRGPGPGPDAFGYGDEAKAKADQDWVRQYMPALQHAANNGPQASDPARQIIRLLRANLDGGQ